MNTLVIVGIVLAVVVALLLTVLLIRGRFGTPSEQGEFELDELLHSGEVPHHTLRREVAACRGHSLDAPSLVGAGVLWLTADDLGFVRRTPRRHVHVPVRSVISAEPASRYARPGIEETSDRVDFLVVEWETADGPATVAFQLPDPGAWAADIMSARGPGRRSGHRS